MKFALVLATLLAAAVMMTGAGGAAVSFADHDKVAKALAKSATLVSQPDLSVQGSHREVAGQVEVHEKETDVLYITDGEATIVTGGTMVGGKQKSPGQMLGTSIGSVRAPDNGTSAEALTNGADQALWHVGFSAGTCCGSRRRRG